MAQRNLVQVTRVHEGVLEYGWRPSSDTLGDPSVEHWTTSAAVPDGYVAWMMNESFYGTNKSAGVGRWALCPTCQEEFPVSEMVLVGGRFYCTKNGDAEERLSDS